MQGYQLTFFTAQDRTHAHRPLAHWLLEEARRIGIGGATVIPAAEGFGHHGRIHSAHFFELGDQPVEVTLAVSEAEAKRLFGRLREEGINIFYVKTPIEYGMSGDL
jgi:PII-like signaling protein